jgi:hypothetical protein
LFRPELAALANAEHWPPSRVGASLIVLRIQQPKPQRAFKAPAWPLVGASDPGCIYLFISPPVSPQVNFFIWNGAGLVLYLVCAAHTRIASMKRQRRLMACSGPSGAVDFSVRSRPDDRRDDGVSELGAGAARRTGCDVVRHAGREGRWLARCGPHDMGRCARSGGGACPSKVCEDAEVADQGIASVVLTGSVLAGRGPADVAAWRHELMLRGLRAQLCVRS